MNKATIEGKKTLLTKYNSYLERLSDPTSAREAVFEDFVIQVKRASRLVVGMSAKRTKIQEAIRIWDAFTALVKTDTGKDIAQGTDAGVLRDIYPSAFND